MNSHFSKKEKKKISKCQYDHLIELAEEEYSEKIASIKNNFEIDEEY